MAASSCVMVCTGTAVATDAISTLTADAAARSASRTLAFVSMDLRPLLALRAGMGAPRAIVEQGPGPRHGIRGTGLPESYPMH